MNKHSDKAYIIHILESIDRVALHLTLLSAGKKWFEQPTVCDAVLRTLQVMSESCKLLSDDAKARMPEINWRRISGFRNILVHDYLGELNYAIITEAIDKELPKLKAAMELVKK